MRIIKIHGYVFFSLNPSEMAKNFIAFVIKVFNKVWRDLPKAHTEENHT